MALPYRSYALVSLPRIVANYQSLGRAVGPGVEVMAVVKADAYGHGAIPVAQALYAAGARRFAVSCISEGIALREAGLRDVEILLMGGLLPFEYEAAVAHDLTPALHELSQVRLLDEAARAAGRIVPFHIKLDTGMNRMGVRADSSAILAAAAAAPNTRLDGLMTHLASPSDFASQQTERQFDEFHAVERGLREAGVAPRWVHTSSSNAIAFARRAGWHTMVRAGLALYGYLSEPEGEAPACLVDVRPALTWKARILVVKDIPEGALVGYSGTFRAPRAMRIGVIAAGYADGVYRHLSNRGHVIAAGRLTPILGTVSMDLTTIDLSHAPHLAPGDEVTLLGSEGGVTLDADQIAAVAGTISYTVLCAIGKRVQRVYE